MVAFFQQLETLIWKNAVLKVRNPKVLFLEILIPAVVMIALVELRSISNGKTIQPILPSDISAFSPNLHHLYKFPPCNAESIVWRCCSSSFCSPTDGGFQNCQRKYVAVTTSSSNESSAWVAATNFITWGNAFVKAPKNETTFVLFESENSFLDYMNQPQYSLDPSIPIYSAAIVFSSGSPSWDYTVRMNKTLSTANDQYSLPQTSISQVNNVVKTADESPVDGSTFTMNPYLESYVNFGYFSLTETVNSYINTLACRNSHLCSADEDVSLRVVGGINFPQGQVKTNQFWTSVGSFFALLMILAMLYPLSNAIKTLVVEKETKLREGFMIMSQRSDAMWIAWMFNFIALYLPLSIILMIIGQALFVYSESIFIFLYFFMFFMASTSYCILISVMFSKSKSASILGALVFFGGYFVYVGLSSKLATLSKGQLMLACIHPATAFTFGTLAFQEYEDSQIGITSYTYNVSNEYAITFGDTILMQFVNYIYLLVLAWYLAEVWPSEYGTSRPVYFIFQKSYWKFVYDPIVRLFGGDISLKRVGNQYSKANQDESRQIELGNRNNDEGHLYSNDVSVDGNVEPVSEEFRAQIAGHRCIQIHDLVKKFETATGLKIAVDGLNLTIYSGQITALLGHNGAGMWLELLIN